MPSTLVKRRPPSFRGAVERVRAGVAVIGRGRAVGFEKFAALAQCIQVALPGMCVFAGQVTERVHIVGEVRVVGIDDSIRTEGGKDAALPASIVLQGLVMGEGICSGVGG